MPTTLAVAPTTAADLVLNGGKTGAHAVRQLTELTTAPGPDQLLAPSFVPVNVAALVGAGQTTELPLQVARGDQVLHDTDLHPSAGSWVEADAAFSSADGDNLTAGLHAVGATQLVLGDTALAPTNDSSGQTFAQPFDLALGHGGHITAAASDSQMDARFTAHPDDPVLAANQLLASLSFVHFENEFETDARGVGPGPASGWHPSSAFMATLLSGLSNTEIVTPVTLDQLISQVPAGGNGEPATRHLQSGPGVGKGGITATASARILTARAHLNSFANAIDGHPTDAGHALRRAAGHREPAAPASAGPLRPGRLRPPVERRPRHHFAGGGTHHHLHLAHRLHPHHRAVHGAVQHPGRAVALERQVHLPRRLEPPSSPSTTPPPRCG